MKLTRIFIENLMEYDIWGAKSSKQARKGSPWSLPFLIQFSYLSFFAFFSGSAAPIISVWILTIEVTPGTHTIAICCLTEWQHCQVEGANIIFWCFEEATLFVNISRNHLLTYNCTLILEKHDLLHFFPPVTSPTDLGGKMCRRSNWYIYDIN